MKTLLITVLCFLSLNTFADESFDCRQKTDVSVPKRVSLDGAGRWYLTVDKKEIKKFEVNEESKHLELRFKKYLYQFDDSLCEDEGVGSATLLLNGKTVHYDCECAID